MRSIHRALAPLLLALAGLSAPAFACQQVSTVLRPGQMLDGVFAHWGVTRSDAFVWGQKIAHQMPLRMLRAGNGKLNRSVHTKSYTSVRREFRVI